MMWEVRIPAVSFATPREAAALLLHPEVVAVNKRPYASGPEWAVAVEVEDERAAQRFAKRMGWQPLAVRAISDASVHFMGLAKDFGTEHLGVG